jgi:hypothetical protein
MKTLMQQAVNCEAARGRWQRLFGVGRWQSVVGRVVLGFWWWVTGN